jgi:hypothetical protein
MIFLPFFRATYTAHTVFRLMFPSLKVIISYSQDWDYKIQVTALLDDTLYFIDRCKSCKSACFLHLQSISLSLKWW